MVTLDQVEFYLTGFQPVGIHRSTSNSCSGSTRNPVNDMGYEGLVIRASGFVETQTAYDQMMDAIMTEGHHDLIVDSGWYYPVHSTRKTRNMAIGYSGYYPFEFTCITEDPFIRSTTSTIRTKSITSGSQTWNADDSSNDITTDGNVPSRPTIVLTAGAIGSYFTRQCTEIDETDDTTFTDSTYPTYTLKKTVSLPAKAGHVYNIIYFSAELNAATYAASYKMTYQAASLNGGVETDAATLSSGSGGYTLKSATLDITTAENETLTLRFYLRTEHDGYEAYAKNTRYIVDEYKKNVIEDVVLCNIADTSIALSACGQISPGTVVTINPDGTGTFDYTDDCSTSKSIDDCYDHSDCSYNESTDTIDLTVNGYIIYRVETYYSIVSVPALVSRIAITGSTSIQIAEDLNNAPDTWYDIATSIVDDVETEYDLADNAGNVTLARKSLFWLKIACSSATASIKSLSIQAALVTIDAQIPLINTGEDANTFRCDQDENSSIECTISLQYEDRKWA